MTLTEQEQILVNRLVRVTELEDRLRKMLASVRGGKKVEILVDERPDNIKEDETN